MSDQAKGTLTTTIAKVLLAAAVIWGAVFATTKVMEGIAGKQREAYLQIIATERARADVAEQERDKAKAEAVATHAEAESWKTQAETHKAKAMALAKDLKTAKDLIRDLGELVPITDPGSLPETTQGLAQAFVEVGLPPIPFIPSVQGADLGWPIAIARPMLGLVRDGQAYPKALEKTAAQETAIGILTVQTEELGAALDDKTKEAETQAKAYDEMATAEAACEKQATALKAEIKGHEGLQKATDLELKAERPKKYLWGAGGVGIGWILKVLVALI
jgi:hypothetical protein